MAHRRGRRLSYACPVRTRVAAFPESLALVYSLTCLLAAPCQRRWGAGCKAGQFPSAGSAKRLRCGSIRRRQESRPVQLLRSHPPKEIEGTPQTGRNSCVNFSNTLPATPKKSSGVIHYPLPIREILYNLLLLKDLIPISNLSELERK